MPDLLNELYAQDSYLPCLKFINQTTLKVIKMIEKTFFITLFLIFSFSGMAQKLVELWRTSHSPKRLTCF